MNTLKMHLLRREQLRTQIPAKETKVSPENQPQITDRVAAKGTVTECTSPACKAETRFIKQSPLELRGC